MVYYFMNEILWHFCLFLLICSCKLHIAPSFLFFTHRLLLPALLILNTTDSWGFTTHFFTALKKSSNKLYVIFATCTLSNFRISPAL